MLESLSAWCTSIDNHKMFRETGNEIHQGLHTCRPRPVPVPTTIHTALTHLEQSNAYMRMLFIDFSSAFNTINPGKLVNKLLSLGLDYHLCSWIKDFLSNRPQPLDLETSSPLPSSSTLALPKAVFSAHSYTHSSHRTPLPFITQITYTSFQMTQL